MSNKSEQERAHPTFVSILPQEREANISVPHLPLKDGSKVYYCDLLYVP